MLGRIFSLAFSYGACVLLLVFSLSLLGPFAASSQELLKMAFPYSPMGLNSLPWMVAKEARLFEKYGLDVDMVFIGASSVIVQSMLSGSANIAGFSGPAVIANVFRGGDIILVAATVPHFTQSLMVKPDIKEIQDLKGKKVGASRFGSVTDFALRAILDRYGLTGAVTVLQMGGLPESLAALSRGLIDGAMVSPPQTFQLVKDGFRELIGPKDLQRLGIRFVSQGITVRRPFAVKNSELVKGVIKATTEAVRYIALNEAFSKKVISKYIRVTDPELLDRSYRYTVGNFPKEPFVPVAAIQSMLQQMIQMDLVDLGAANRTPLTAIFDNRFVQELKDAGFFGQLWR